MTTTPETTTPAETAKGRGGYLPALPDGWEYHIQIMQTGGDGSEPGGNIVVQAESNAHDNRTGNWLVHVHSSAGRKSLTRGSIGEALRSAVASVKVLSRLAKAEAEHAAAREAALAEIGGDDVEPEPEDAPRIAEPVAAGSLAQHTAEMPSDPADEK